MNSCRPCSCSKRQVKCGGSQRQCAGRECAKQLFSIWFSTAMNREDHFYPSQIFKDSCAYQRSHGAEYNSSPPPCLYMSRQVHSVYTPPSMGGLEQASLPDISPSYTASLRDEVGVPQLHHPQVLQQQPHQPAAYTDSVDQSRYQLPFPWMKTTKSHSHTWRGQWAGKFFYYFSKACCVQ